MKGEALTPAKSNRTVQRAINKDLYKDRNKVERFFGGLRHNRRVAVNYEKTAHNYMTIPHLVRTIVWLLELQTEFTICE